MIALADRGLSRLSSARRRRCFFAGAKTGIRCHDAVHHLPLRENRMLASVASDRPNAPSLLAHAQRVFEKQRAQLRAVTQSGPAERRAKLERLRDAILAHRAEIVRAMHDDFHKPRVEVELTETQQVLAEIKHAIGHLKGWMKPQGVTTPFFLSGTRSYVRYEPKGVVLVLAPWNYPLQLTLSPVVAAIAAGNCVIARPSEKAPHAGRVIAKILAAAFDEAEVACVTGGVDVADGLLELPFDHIFFTGSTRIGKRVMAAAAKHLCSVTLELGGKSPVVIDASADLAQAADRIVWGKFVNAGQTCVAPDYVLVPRALETPFHEAAAKVVATFYGKDPSAQKESADYCHIVDDASFDRLRALLETSRARGEKFVTGGQTDAASRFIAPTILGGVAPDAPIMEHEIFGPILPVVAYDRVEDALDVIVAKGKPLAMYVFSGSASRGEELLSQVPAGGGCVNNVLIHLSNPHLPFGGAGDSGMGSYHGFYGFRAFSHERAVLVQGRPSLASIFNPPFGPKTERALKWIGRLNG
jgi:aldehyde dehydrogenase (NAD+)